MVNQNNQDDDDDSDIENRDTCYDLLEIKKQDALEEQMMRRDTILRKMPKNEIRRESFYDNNPIRQASILDRITANDEITNASIRQAQRKSTLQS